METKVKKKGKKAKFMIPLACAAVVGISVYADWSYNSSKGIDTGGYLYNSEITGENVKILGEATYVGGDMQDIDSENVNETVNENDSYFAIASADRRRSRDESLSLLQTVVDSSESMPDEKSKALSDMTTIAAAIEAESNIETLVRAKGFDDCVAVVSGDDATVVVKSAGLLTYEVAQIREIVMNELSIPAENIKIIEKTE